MRYAKIESFEICNGEGIGISLFVQGCNFHCKNCFNPDTWDFYGGKEWTEETEEEFFKLINRPYIKRVSILGGEPLSSQNLDEVLDLVNKITILLPNKTIWLYTGYTLDIYEQYNCDHTIIDTFPRSKDVSDDIKRADIIRKCDVIVDGRYEEPLKDVSLHWRGSSNQRVIDVQESIKQNKVVLYNT